MNITWFLIINPTAGNKKFDNKWQLIKNELTRNNINYVYKKTTHASHEITIIKDAIKEGYKHFISVGGDGTLHHVVNGVMLQQFVSSKEITIGVIPLGTGNDWVKTYKIPKNIKKAIKIIKSNNTFYQDIGFLELDNAAVYFNNVAGIGYDAYVVNKLKKLKYLGSISYILSGLYGLLFYKKTVFKIAINNTIIETKCLMTAFGICKYSGGGMQFTNYQSANDGLLDIAVIKNMTFLNLLFNLPKLYNGLLMNHSKVDTLNTKNIKITPSSLKTLTYIQADGELIGTGEVTVSICKEALKFVVP